MAGDAKARIDFSRHPRRELPKDDTLFVEDEESGEMYVLLAGALGVFRNEIQVATIEEPLSIVGEISALTAKPRNATVRALRYCKLVVIDDPAALFAEYPQMGAKLARLLAARLDAMNGRFVELKNAVTRARAERDMRLEGELTAATYEDMERAAGGPSRGGPAVEVGAAATAPPSAGTDDVEIGARAAAATPAGGAEVAAQYENDVFETLGSMLDWDLPGT